MFVVVPPCSLSAMAPKRAFGPKIVGSERIKLDDFSLEEDSGWREADEERVAELIEMIKDMPWLGITYSCLQVAPPWVP